jgi:hypothetical protein
MAVDLIRKVVEVIKSDISSGYDNSFQGNMNSPVIYLNQRKAFVSRERYDVVASANICVKVMARRLEGKMEQYAEGAGEMRHGRRADHRTPYSVSNRAS